MKTTEQIFLAFKNGELTLEETMIQLKSHHVTELTHTIVDIDRERRTGVPEVIFGQGKTPEQIIEITKALKETNNNILITRISPEGAESFLKVFPEGNYNKIAKIMSITVNKKVISDSHIAIVTAGTSDQPIAEEAALTAEFLGNQVKRYYDCGVAGLHRLLVRLEDIRKAKVIIAIAGMEGALPSVLAGLVKAPVIAVPTSVGYGANFQGITTLLAMMNSCANGISVVNIDNGFGAAYNAHLINNL